MLYFQPKKKTAPCWSYSSSERSRNLQPAKRFFLLVSNMSHSWWTPVLYPSQHQSDMRRFNSARSGTVHGVLQIYPRNFGAMQEAASCKRQRLSTGDGRIGWRPAACCLARERERDHTQYQTTHGTGSFSRLVVAATLLAGRTARSIEPASGAFLARTCTCSAAS
jgi:hypothetical protein